MKGHGGGRCGWPNGVQGGGGAAGNEAVNGDANAVPDAGAAPVYPYEARWQPSAVAGAAQVAGATLGLCAAAVVLPVVAGVILLVIARGKPLSWLDAVAFVLVGVVPVAEVGAFIAMASRGNAKRLRGGPQDLQGAAERTPLNRGNLSGLLPSDTQDAGTGASCNGAKGDARYIVPSANDLRKRIAEGGGIAFPLLEEFPAAAGSGNRQRPVRAAWRIPAASELHASPGVITASLSLPVVKTVRRYDGYSAVGAVMHFFELEFRETNGTRRKIWTDATPSWFFPGQHVTVYHYATARFQAPPVIRIHDVADARHPQSVVNHETVLFSLAMFDHAVCGETCGKGTFGDWACAQSWGVHWRGRVCAVGYSEDRRIQGTGIRDADGAHAGDAREKEARGASRFLPTRVSDFVIGRERIPFQQMEDPVGTVLHRHWGIVEDAVVIPLFNRRYWCGYGYMALVSFSHLGMQKCAWAFCDPERGDSYLGDDTGNLRPIPVRAGDSVTLWRAIDGLCIVDPSV